AAPLGLLGLSPAPFVLGAGIALLYAFALWSERCRASGRMPLIAPELVRGARERSALVSIFAIGAISAGLTFLMPLYIEVVQGRTSLYTALALAPLTFASFSAAVFVMRLTARLSSRRIAQYALLLVAAGVALLGVTVRNDWSDALVVLGLILTGLGEGGLATLLFKLLSRTVPR